MDKIAKITTTGQLLNLIQENKKEIEPENLEGLRYAIYLRKSTEDPEKQVRSVEDQRSECIKLAEDNEIIVLEENIIEEHKSAKEVGIRPKFRNLLDRVIAGELDGIIAWHPNRLSRNMGEAGEIIDLLDKKIIKDLKFASHTFVNDPSGKMLLGIVFVMAKQYSEQLSTDINRGNRKSVEVGAYIGDSKHGYYKDINQHLRPDGNNFVLLQEAFQRRLQGETLTDIADFLNTSSYTKRNKQADKTKKPKFSKQSLSNLFGEPIYAGINDYGKNTVDLTKIYDFIPAITVEEFIKINKYDPYEKSFKPKKVSRSKSKREADLLSGKVNCHYCKNNMNPGISKGSKGTPYYYFRCTTKNCERHNKSTRAKVIIDYVIEYLNKKPFSSQETYQSYRNEILRLQKTKVSSINEQINNGKRNLGRINSDIEAIKTNLAKETERDYKKIIKDELITAKDKSRVLRKGIQELEQKKTNISKSPLVFEEFIRVIDEIPRKITKVQNSGQLDSILSKIYLNFSVTQKTVEKYTLKAPFGALECIDETKVSSGGPDRT
jgi:DNA invertase Pin-like site-specific DNA recombinase